jgi:hypothetical protein
MNTVRTTTPVVAAGVPKPKDWRLSEGRRWRRDMRTQQALLLVVVGIGSKAKSLPRVSNAADPQMMTENWRG